MASKNVEIVAARLKAEFDAEVDPATFQRTRAGKHQRAAGAWLWFFIGADRTFMVGGCQPLSEYAVKKNKLDLGSAFSFNDFTVDAYTPEEWARVEQKRAEKRKEPATWPD